MSDKIRLHYTPKALTPEEREFATALGHEVSRALAVAVAHPKMSFPAGGLANCVQKSCQKMLRGPKAAAAQARAAQLLQAGVATRQKYFGNAGDPGSDVKAVAGAGNDLSEALKTKLTKAVNARLVSSDQASTRALAEHLTQINLKKMSHTTVETGHFLGDVVTEGANYTGLHAPSELEFRWSTTEEGANAGRWQLAKKGGGQPVLATGKTGAPGSIFTIDLQKWLPPQPPPNGVEVYEVRVAAYKHTPTAQTSWQELGKTPWQMLGNWSLPVTIKYFKDDSNFAFDPAGFSGPEGANVMYGLDCALDDISLIFDSNEAGGEEFFIAGFLSETLSDGSKTSWDFNFYRELDIDTQKTQTLGYITYPTINLGNPDDVSWPKVYTLFISVMEKDGGNVAPWVKDLHGAVKEFILAKVWAEMKKVLSDLKAAGVAALAAAVTGAAVAEVAAATAASIAAILSTACAVLWVLVAVVVAVVIIGEIIEGVDNDSYGSTGCVLVLPTNLYDYFEHVEGEYKSEGNEFVIWNYNIFTIEPSGIFADQGKIGINSSFVLRNLGFWYKP